MSDLLTDDLRREARWWQEHPAMAGSPAYVPTMLLKSADRIEELERENAKLWEALQRYGIRNTGYGKFCLICETQLSEERTHYPGCLLYTE